MKMIRIYCRNFMGLRVNLLVVGPSMVCNTEWYHPVWAVCIGPTAYRYADHPVPERATVLYCSSAILLQ